MRGQTNIFSSALWFCIWKDIGWLTGCLAMKSAKADFVTSVRISACSMLVPDVSRQKYNIVHSVNKMKERFFIWKGNNAPDINYAMKSDEMVQYCDRLTVVIFYPRLECKFKMLNANIIPLMRNIAHPYVSNDNDDRSNFPYDILPSNSQCDSKLLVNFDGGSTNDCYESMEF